MYVKSISHYPNVNTLNLIPLKRPLPYGNSLSIIFLLPDYPVGFPVVELKYFLASGKSL